MPALRSERSCAAQHNDPDPGAFVAHNDMDRTASPVRPLPPAILLGMALLITLLLFFVDEGRYSFSGLFDADNLLALAFYLAGMVLGLFLMAQVVVRWRPGILRTLFVLVLGPVAGFVLGLLFLVGAGALLH